MLLKWVQKHFEKSICNAYVVFIPIQSMPSASGVFSMDEDSVSRDCEPFFESDGEEESTDGERSICRASYVHIHICA